MKFPLLFAGALFLSGVIPLLAQDASPAGTPSAPDDIKVIRQILEQQSRQIESLTGQVEALARLIREHQGVLPESRDTTPADMPPSSDIEDPDPDPYTAQNAVPVRPATAARRTHVVIKGESFTSIAKKYGITVDELLRLNPVKDPRKLQIGESLRLPIVEESEQTASPTPGIPAASPSPGAVQTPPERQPEPPGGAAPAPDNQPHPQLNP